MSANQVSNDPSGSEFLLDEYQSDSESAEKSSLAIMYILY